MTKDDFVPVTAADVTDEALLPKRFDMFAAEARHAFCAIEATQKAIDRLNDKILPLIQEIREELHNHQTRLVVLEREKSAHGERLNTYDTKHSDHDSRITGVFQRLTVLETASVNQPKPKRRTRSK